MFKEEIITILIGMTPISELRGAIPFALGVFHFSPIHAYFFSVLGNLIPIIPLFLFLKFISSYLSNHFEFFKNLLDGIFARTRIKYKKRFDYEGKRKNLRPLLESITLFLFVAIPLPFTGVWSGTIAAFVFGVPLRRSFLAMTLGVLVSGIIVLGLSLGAIRVF